MLWATSTEREGKGEEGKKGRRKGGRLRHTHTDKEGWREGERKREKGRERKRSLLSDNMAFQRVSRGLTKYFPELMGEFSNVVR